MVDMPQHRPHHDIGSLFSGAKDFLRVCAPMVRYSKLEFRRLVRQNGVQLAFTPMMISESINNSEMARQKEFSSAVDDEPVIAQFAARDATEFVTSAQLIYPYVDGIDLNCGCPQSWAKKEGFGCELLNHPETVRDIVQCIRRTLPTDFSVSVKMRLLQYNDTATSVLKTIELAQQLEHCGVTFLTLHGRLPTQKNHRETLNVEAMADVRKSLQIPLIVNGCVDSLKDARELHEQTQAAGVMAARGLLANPALFNSDYALANSTPRACVQQWLDIAEAAGDHLKFSCFHHHLSFMWSDEMKRSLRIPFNSLGSKSEVLAFLDEHYDLRPSENAASSFAPYTNCTYNHFTPPRHARHIAAEARKSEWDENQDGKFFSEFKTQQLVDNNSEDLELGDFFGDDE
ncbi:tRNA-dihydrouridine(20a/20b) synthase [NAD(P)+]-like [Drosophila busckii]|uniref:tRNA-dihydrouridine(20a/20b) synthase [NAD(P)+]-like n=1 Tax=Drosophila busckii TaxID=30019 RepID=UPI001433153E|nr:tRNA-dihydrouridine(20a/20b) synthase [NAD(P)+]-like [Drosophila busckii]